MNTKFLLVTHLCEPFSSRLHCKVGGAYNWGGGGGAPGMRTIRGGADSLASSSATHTQHDNSTDRRGVCNRSELNFPHSAVELLVPM